MITITDPGKAVGASHEIDGTFIQTAAGTLALRVNAAGASDSLFAFSNLAGTLRAVVQPGLYGMTTIYDGFMVACFLQRVEWNEIRDGHRASPGRAAPLRPKQLVRPRFEKEGLNCKCLEMRNCRSSSAL